MLSSKRLLIIMSLVILLASAGPAGAVEDSQTFVDTESAGPDFQVQGEYEGTIGGSTKIGAQVIALGDGRFNAVLYAKGLPGAGWDGLVKVRMSGETVDGTTRLTGKNFRGEIIDGVFSGVAEDDLPFEMKKIERKSPTLGAQPPEGAIVLFDGSDVSAWEIGKLADGGLLAVGTRTKQKFKDFTLHLEFRTPFMPYARGQGRGNSGMYLLDQYECQILDSFGLEGEDNECGGFYKLSKPKVNMCLPPLSWQTYDVEFKAARFDAEGNKTANAVATVRHNGVVIHENYEFQKITPGGHQSDEKPGALYLQNHSNPVHFRNIWIKEK